MITPEQYIPITNKHNPLYGLTHELCMAAVSKDGCALQYVHQQTPELCMAAVTQNRIALQYVHDEFYQQVVASLTQ